jgi:hypothetical protein
MTRRPALQSGDKVRIADGKFDPALIARVKQVDGDLVEVQFGGWQLGILSPRDRYRPRRLGFR